MEFILLNKLLWANLSINKSKSSFTSQNCYNPISTNDCDLHTMSSCSQTNLSFRYFNKREHLASNYLDKKELPSYEMYIQTMKSEAYHKEDVQPISNLDLQFDKNCWLRLMLAFSKMEEDFKNCIFIINNLNNKSLNFNLLEIFKMRTSNIAQTVSTNTEIDSNNNSINVIDRNFHSKSEEMISLRSGNFYFFNNQQDSSFSQNLKSCPVSESTKSPPSVDYIFGNSSKIIFTHKARKFLGNFFSKNAKSPSFSRKIKNMKSKWKSLKSPLTMSYINNKNETLKCNKCNNGINVTNKLQLQIGQYIIENEMKNKEEMDVSLSSSNTMSEQNLNIENILNSSLKKSFIGIQPIEQNCNSSENKWINSRPSLNVQLPQEHVINDKVESSLKEFATAILKSSGDTKSYEIIDKPNHILKRCANTIFNINNVTKSKKADVDLKKVCSMDSSNLLPKKVVQIKLDIIDLKRSILDHNNLFKIELNQLASEFNRMFKTNYLEVVKDSNKKVALMENNLKDNYLLKEQELKQCKHQLNKETKRRRELHEIIQELLGNIRVYCRVRNVNEDNSDISNNIIKVSKKSKNCLLVKNEKIVSPTLEHGKSPNWLHFTYDHIFDVNTTQTEMYQEFQPLIQSFLDGYNVCIISYGSEGSGKTYSMIGSSSDSSNNNDGLIPHTMMNILQNLKASFSMTRENGLIVSALEIYNNKLIDFFSETSKSITMPLFEGSLTEISVLNRETIDEIMLLCRKNRHQSKTMLNACSSRSHLLIWLKIGQKSQSQLIFCDLAGFENVFKAGTQSNEIQSLEARHINKSLLAFHRLFVQMGDWNKSNNILFRECKLTEVLKPFFVGHSKCVIVLTVRNDKICLPNSISTLKFGSETRKVLMGGGNNQQIEKTYKKLMDLF